MSYALRICLKILLVFACHIVEDWIVHLGCAFLVEDVETLETFEVFLIVNVSPGHQFLKVATCQVHASPSPENVDTFV